MLKSKHHSHFTNREVRRQRKMDATSDGMFRFMLEEAAESPLHRGPAPRRICPVLSEVGKSSGGHGPAGHCQLLDGCENLLVTPPASQLRLILFPSTKQPKNLTTDAPGGTV